MPASIQIVERVEDQIKFREPLHRVLCIFDVGVMRNQFDTRVELLCHLFCNQSLRLFDVLLSEQKLAIEIAEIDSVEIDDVNFTKPRLD